MSAPLPLVPRQPLTERALRFPGETPDGKAKVDAWVEDVRRLTSSGRRNRWELAELVIAAVREQLWEHRKDCTSFKQLIESETDLSDSYASRLLAAADFGREAFEQHGLRKLYAISTAPEETHARLLAACDGAKVVDIEAMARAARPTRPDGEPAPGRPPRATLLTSGIVLTMPTDDGSWSGDEVQPDGSRMCIMLTPPKDGETSVEISWWIEPAGAAP